MTSIDFLVSKIASKIDDKYYSNQQDITEYVEQANKMFEQQIIDAWNSGDYAYFYSKETGRDFADGSEYYNETYGCKGSETKQ